MFLDFLSFKSLFDLTFAYFIFERLIINLVGISAKADNLPVISKDKLPKKLKLFHFSSFILFFLMGFDFRA